jgi:MraZ protein
MTDFYGQYRHSVDEKGRLSIPADFRPMLLGDEGQFFINRGFEGCIMAVPERKWERVRKRVNAAAIENEKIRWFKRTFFSGVKKVSCDQQGRILIPQFLMEYAKITKEVVIIGISDSIEIWDAETWNTLFEQHIGQYEQMAEQFTQPGAPEEATEQDTCGGE